ncbi:uncharacterized protein A4U43_C04F14820 [Asparagus officinalis]|uniref:J domain-containing protein n=1 Tax=Asparagus officinalis TaxID=4686 RepID=A0A5P1F5R5_ASPOF|nr:uncharacterized protein LOC109837315 [Asparagus officinalis]ONK72021.1 uncharacterized protein A4U43_C04F14820 [Asparagus officinalis]
MECNRDEALRAKEIAERKFQANDLGGAKKFALKAQNLYPPLDGIDQMISTLNVHLSSIARFDGEKDWYAILSSDPSADEETVRKQYRKLALLFHPDKNKSIGAEGAFKLISEAWSVLSDKSKRTLYDHKRFGRTFQRKTNSTVKKDNSVPNSSNGVHTPANNAPSKVRVQKTYARTAPTPIISKSPPSRPSKPGTFWTSCLHCKMQYEYLRVYLNLNLQCPSCQKPFVASENVVPAKGPDDSSQPSSQLPQQNSDGKSSTKNCQGASGFRPDFTSSSKFQWGPFSRTTGTASASASTTAAAQAANVVHHTYEKVRREREQAQAAARREEAIRSELKRNSSGAANLNAGVDGNGKVEKPAKRKRSILDDPIMNYGVGTGHTGLYYANFSAAGLREFYLRRGFPQAHVLTKLMTKSKNDLHKVVETWISQKACKAAEKESAKKKQKLKEIVDEKVKEVNHENAAGQDRVDGPVNNSKQPAGPPMSDSARTQDANSDKEVAEPVNIDVPDADFHDFDKDRTEKSFKADDIWATYDNEDGMPRYYALIQKVISYEPFKVRMSFLNSKTNSEFGPLNWVASGFAKTSGEFRVGRYEVNDALNVFSHRVKWEKGLRGVIKIVPRQGEIWALYRNWSPDWNEHTPDEVMYKYDMVEVLEDYSEEQGVCVAPLVKVAEFKTVFHRHPDPMKVKKIPREEIFRLSHQVPSYVLTGDEGPGAPRGCYELDPAATPLELLQVVKEIKGDEVMQVSELQQKTNS